jgi:hypothetical protein
VRLVDSHAPFSLATTPGGTSLVTSSGRMTSPRSFHIRTSMPCPRPRSAASLGFISGGGGLREPARSPSVEEMRLSEDGEISMRGWEACRARQTGSKAAAPHRLANVSDLSSILPDSVAGKTFSKRTSGLPSGPVICSALRVGIWLGRMPANRGSAVSTASSISSSSVALKHGSSKPKRAARRRKISVFGSDSPTGGITASARCSQ